MNQSRRSFRACQRRVLFGLVVVSAAVGACNDGIPCPGPGVLFFQAPLGAVSLDTDTSTDGIQTTVALRTDLPEGSPVTVTLWANAREAGTATGVVDAKGAVTIPNVTLPSGQVALRAKGEFACGVARDEVEVEVVGAQLCELTFAPEGRVDTYYKPALLFGMAEDQNPVQSGLQIAAQLRAQAGWTFRVVRDSTTTFASAPADGKGQATIPLALPEGESVVRGVCLGPKGQVVETTARRVYVDTTPPTCVMVSPGAGTTLNPAHDQNHDLSDGLQVALTAQLQGPDVAGEPVSFAVGPTVESVTRLPAAPADASGQASSVATIAPAQVPAEYVILFDGRDHAGNSCGRRGSYPVVYDGCALAVTQPLSPVTVDADGNVSNGAQLDVVVDVDRACAGRTVHSACANLPSAVVSSTGRATLRHTMCNAMPCEQTLACTFAITSAAGIETRTTANLAFDNKGPEPSLTFAGGQRCGDTITVADDANSGSPGVQLRVTLAAPGAATRELTLVNGAGSTQFPGGDQEVTLASGVNQLLAAATDPLGNRTTLPACTITLADLAVSFAANAADGWVGLADGTVASGQLNFQLCGSVSRTGAAVSVRVNGGTALPATVTGSTWCRALTLAESRDGHTVVVDATASGSFGRASLLLRVDLTRPPGPSNMVLTAPDHQSLRAAWVAPSDNGARVETYALKVSTTALTDANFDSVGTVVATAVPAAPGANELVTLPRLRVNTPYWVALAARDLAGNRSPATVLGPLAPSWDQTGALGLPNGELGVLEAGRAMAVGKFNDDEYDDVAVGAPGQLGGLSGSGAVYVYFGGPAGIRAAPDVTLSGATGERFGEAAVAVRRGGAARDDLWVGAPLADGGAGRVYVFRGPMAAGTRNSSSADVIHRASAATPGWFAGAQLGARLVAGNFDSDGVRDVAIGAPAGGGGRGGVVVVYGGTATGPIAFSDITPTGLSGAIVELIEEPRGASGRQFGAQLHAVGPTRAARTTHDLAIAYVDSAGSNTDSLFVYRHDGGKPGTSSVVRRAFAAGRDVQIDLVAGSAVTEFGVNVTTVPDLNSDGARELVISAQRASVGGQVYIVSGNLVGTNGLARIADAGVLIATLSGRAGASFGAAVTAGDVDGDGREDLVVAGLRDGVAALHIWYYGGYSARSLTQAQANSVVTGPAGFGWSGYVVGKALATMTWIGDLNRDGLSDLVWASPSDANGDGLFEALWDDRR